MILRRFMKHVTDQNWFAVGLDVIVVIVGIFLGLQVQALYDGRAVQEEEQRVIGYMISDVESSLKFLDKAILGYDDRINLSDKAIEIIETGVLKTEDIEGFENALVRIGRTSPLDPYLNSFDDDNLSRILNSDMRRVIGKFLSRVRLIKNIINLLEEKLYRAKVITNTKAPVRGRGNEQFIVYYDFDRLKTDDQYLAAIINMNSAQTSFKIRFNDMRDISQQLLKILKQYQAGETIEEVSFQ